MADAWRALPDGRQAVQQVLPTTLNWPLFWVALLLMASPALHRLARLLTQRAQLPAALTFILVHDPRHDVERSCAIMTMRARSSAGRRPALGPSCDPRHDNRRRRTPLHGAAEPERRAD